MYAKGRLALSAAPIQGSCNVASRPSLSRGHHALGLASPTHRGRSKARPQSSSNMHFRWRRFVNQVRIIPAFSHQFFVVALFNNAALVHNINHVSIPHR